MNLKMYMLDSRGVTLVQFGIVLGILGVLVFSGFQVVPLVLLEREHQTFRHAVDAEIQSLSAARLPETETELTDVISRMLDSMDAHYQSHHIQVHIEQAQQRLTVQIWYTRSHPSLLADNPKQFYVQAEKTELPVNITAIPTPTPSPSETSRTSAREETISVATPTPLPPEPTQAAPVVKRVQLFPAKSVTDTNFTQEVLNSSTPVMVNFWADWCGVCRRSNPVVDEAARKFAGQMKIVKVNVDRSKKAASNYGVRGVPAFVFFKDGKVVGRQSGFGGKSWLFALIQKQL